MSSEEAVQEVRRIFVNNSVEQAHNYLATITRGIQESDEQLKQIVGQSYRDLIAACDQVVGMERTCRRLLRLQKRLQSGPAMSPPSPGAAEELRDQSSALTKRIARAADSTASLQDVPEEEPVVAAATAAGADCRDGDATMLPECRQLLLQQRRVAMEGFLGAQQVQKAAFVLRELRGLLQHNGADVEGRKDAGGFYSTPATERNQQQRMQEEGLLESYSARLHHAMRELLRKDADDAAQRVMETARDARCRSRGVATGGNALRRRLSMGVGANSVAEGDEWADATAHMAEAHEALGVLFSAPAPDALMQLMDLVFAMIERDVQLITEATTGARQASPPGRGDDVIGSMRRTERLRMALPLPAWLLADGAESSALAAAERAHFPDTTRTTSPAAGGRSALCRRGSGGATSGAAIALHLAQRAQYLFFHLVTYVASVAPRFFSPTRGDGGSEASAQRQRNSDLADEKENVDVYVNDQRRHRSLQSLLTLRGRLAVQQQQQVRSEGRDVEGANESMPPRMSGNFTRHALSASQQTAGTESADHSLDVSTSAMSMDLANGPDAPRQTRLRRMYLREVMHQVCGMQLLDPHLFLPHKTETKCDRLSSHGSDGTIPRVTVERVRQRLMAVQDSVARLLACIADAGLLCSPRYIALQEFLARREGTRLKEWLAQNDRSGRGSHDNNNGDGGGDGGRGAGGYHHAGGDDLCLFAASKWERMVEDTTERALLKTIGAALRKADVVCNSILQRVCAEDRYHSLSIQQQQQEEAQRQLSTSTDGAVSVKPMTLSQLSQRVLFCSLCVGQLISAGRRCGNEEGRAALPVATPPKETQDHAGERTATDVMLARAMVRCVWSSSRSSVDGGAHGGSLPDGKNSHGTTELTATPARHILSGLFKGLLCAGDDEMDADDDDEADCLFADDIEESEEERAGKKGNDQANGASVGDDNNNDGDKDRRALMHMLQRIFVSGHVWTAKRASVQDLVTAWIENVLRRVQDVIQKTKETHLYSPYSFHQQQLQHEEEFFGRVLPMMVMFHRLSLFLEVLLGAVEASRGMFAAAESLVAELRETIVVCHTPWVQLLRSEWEHGLCAAYQAAFEAVMEPTSSAGNSLVATRRFALEYAACWRHGTQDRHSSSSPDGGGKQTVSYPVHLTPHVAELLFTLQHILHTVGARQRLQGTVLPILLRELLDGTAAAVSKGVLPSLAGNAASGSRNVCSYHHNTMGNCGGGADPMIPHPAEDASNDNKGNDDDEREEVLLQLYFDVLFMAGMFTPSGVAPASSPVTTLMRTIEARLDPVVWSLTSPLLFSASKQLLRATALSFGSWCTANASNVWSKAGGDNKKRPAVNMHDEEQRLRLMGGAIASLAERERFPLLPLTAAAHTMFPHAGGSGASAKTATVAGAASTRDDGDGGGRAPHSIAAPAKKEAAAPSFATSLLWGNGTTKGWVGSLW